MRTGNAAALARAEELATTLCEQNVGRGCSALAVIALLRDQTETHRAMNNRAAGAYQAGCKAGQARDCVEGAMLIGTMRLGGDPKQERKLLEQGCDLGLVQACVRLASSVTSPRSEEEVQWLRRACEMSGESACLALSGLAQNARSSPVAAAEAPLFLARGLKIARARCDFGETGACNLLGRAVERGLVSVDDGLRDLARLSVLCDRGISMACGELARALEGQNTPIALLDTKRAAVVKKRACALGHPFSCPDPLASLRLYPRIEVPLVDLQTGLSWAPSPSHPEGSTDKSAGCAPGFRLPTRAELLSLVGTDGELRRLARVTSPPRGLLLSSELSDEKSKAPWGLDLISGRIVASDGNNDYRRCVSEKKNEGRAPGGVVHFSLAGDQLWYVLQHGAREGEGTVSMQDLRSPEAMMRLSLSGLDGIQGAIDVEVESSVDFGHAAWVIGAMTRKGITLRRIVAEAPPLRRSRR